MFGWLLLMISSAAVAAPAGQATPASAPATGAAMALFDRDWVLMNWALKYYDGNHDILISTEEARVAAEAFRNLADADHDGRVTPSEYRQAREFILTRY